MSNIKLFESKQVRTEWDPIAKKWYFAIVDVIAVLTESANSGAYWRKLKERPKKEGNETVTNCHGLKMTVVDGKQRLTDGTAVAPDPVHPLSQSRAVLSMVG